MTEVETKLRASELDLPLERDLFSRTLIRELAGTLEDVVGLSDASGYISVVERQVVLIGDESFQRAMMEKAVSQTVS